MYYRVEVVGQFLSIDRTNEEVETQLKYDQKAIGDTICSFIDNLISEPYLRQNALRAVRYKESEFIFSKVTFSHIQVWEKETDDRDVLLLLASVELFVLACDILDDLQDADTTKEPWMQIEAKYTMNLIFLFLSLVRRIIEDTSFSNEHKLWLYETLSTYEVRSLMGQNEDLQQNIEAEETYVQMIERKSGSFMAFACLVGSFQASKEQRMKIEQYALHLGCSAQIENDLAGISEEQGYKDVVGKEISLPILYIRNYKKHDFLPISEYYQGKIDKKEVLSRLKAHKESFRNSGAVAYSRTMQMIHFNKGLAIMDELYQNRQELVTIKSIFIKSE